MTDAIRTQPMPDAPCPGCGTVGSVRLDTVPETVVFRGESIPVEMALRRCSACGSEWENTRDPDWRAERNRVYRERTGLDPRARLA